MPSFHFSLGDSSKGAIGFCARVIASTRTEAAERLRTALASLGPDCDGDFPVFDDVTDDELNAPAVGIAYIRVYFNDEAPTEADIDGEEDADHMDKGRVCHNYYHCPDDHTEWEDPNCDSEHNDRCPTCRAEIQPYKSDWLNSDGDVLETVGGDHLKLDEGSDAASEADVQESEDDS